MVQKHLVRSIKCSSEQLYFDRLHAACMQPACILQAHLSRLSFSRMDLFWWVFMMHTSSECFTIGERDNSVYGMRAGSQGWKGEDGKAKTQWWERGMEIFPSPFLTTVFCPSHPPLSTLDFQPSVHKPNYLFLLWDLQLKPTSLGCTQKWSYSLNTKSIGTL